MSWPMSTDRKRDKKSIFGVARRPVPLRRTSQYACVPQDLRALHLKLFLSLSSCESCAFSGSVDLLSAIAEGSLAKVRPCGSAGPGTQAPVEVKLC